MMDRQLSSRFWLHEFPCWELATEDQVARLQETVARVLQPIRNKFGRVTPSSWMRWEADCSPRTGAHAAGGTVDFYTPDAELWEVFQWGATHLLPSGYIGRWIYEPTIHDEAGRKVQGEHIHVAPRQDMLDVFGRGDIQALQETEDGGQYVYAFYDSTRGTFLDPYTLEPIVVTAGVGFSWWWLLVFFGLFTLDMAGQASGGIRLRTS